MEPDVSYRSQYTLKPLVRKEKEETSAGRSRMSFEIQGPKSPQTDTVAYDANGINPPHPMADPIFIVFLVNAHRTLEI